MSASKLQLGWVISRLLWLILVDVNWQWLQLGGEFSSSWMTDWEKKCSVLTSRTGLVLLLGENLGRVAARDPLEILLEILRDPTHPGELPLIYRTFSGHVTRFGSHPLCHCEKVSTSLNPIPCINKLGQLKDWIPSNVSLLFTSN